MKNAPFMLRLRPAGDAQHERKLKNESEELPFALSVP